MQIIKFRHREDFGHEWYIQVLSLKGWSLLQSSISWNDYPGWPFIQIKSGSGSLLSVVTWCYKLGFDIGVVERTWNFGVVETLDEEDE